MVFGTEDCGGNKGLERLTSPGEVKDTPEQFSKNKRRFSDKNCGKNSKHEQQRDRLIEVAQHVIAMRGLDALKARDLAQEAGIALGQIYNLVEDMDELILLVASRTLAQLEAQLEAALEGRGSTAQENLIMIAVAYHHFARDHYHLWRSLFDHRLEMGKNLPEWVRKERLRPFRFVEQSLAQLMPDATAEQIGLFTQTVFSAIHGMVSLTLNARDVGVRPQRLDEQIAFLLHLLCRGLTAS